MPELPLYIYSSWRVAIYFIIAQRANRS